MKIPVFNEIILEGTSFDEIKKSLRKMHVGQGPTYLVMDEWQDEEFYDILSKLAQITNEMGYNVKLPFPFYIITSSIDYHPIFPVAKSVNDLPSHFRKKVKRLKSKEHSLLAKVEVLSEKLINMELAEKIKKHRDRSSLNKELYKLSSELNFYQFLEDEITKRNKDL